MYIMHIWYCIFQHIISIRNKINGHIVDCVDFILNIKLFFWNKKMIPSESWTKRQTMIPVLNITSVQGSVAGLSVHMPSSTPLVRLKNKSCDFLLIIHIYNLYYIWNMSSACELLINHKYYWFPSWAYFALYIGTPPFFPNTLFLFPNGHKWFIQMQKPMSFSEN